MGHPRELLELTQWLAWKYVLRDGRQTKVPLSPHGGVGKSNDPATWGSHAEAVALGAEGVGFVFSPDDPYCGVDMDRCVGVTGRIHPVAREIVRRLGGYWEFSPSGCGIHVIVRGRLERGRHTLKTPWHNELALYDRGRFFTVSGEGRGQIRDAQPALESLVAEYFPAEPGHAPVARPPAACGDDAAIVARVLDDPRMAALWAGDSSRHGDDRSAGDLALCSHLAFLCGHDPARIDTLFRASARMRDKWNERRGETTYGALTVERACCRPSSW